MTFPNPSTLQVLPPRNLYKWAHIWGKVQKKYYDGDVYLRREKQIEDFVALNGFGKPFIIKDTDVFANLASVSDIRDADIVVVTDQKFSRYPCTEIPKRMQSWLAVCPHLLCCLNRHYLNIDHVYQNTDLSDNYNLAITQWLKIALPGAQVLDLSLDYIDRGDWFTWVIPDRIFYVSDKTR